VFALYLFAATVVVPLTDTTSPDLAVASAAPITSTGLNRPFDDGRVGFSVMTRDGLKLEYSEFALFVSPGEDLEFSATEPVRWRVGTDGADTDPQQEFSWRAPQDPGHHRIALTHESGEGMTLNVIVMQRQEPGQDRINGYRIGEYPVEPYRGRDNYRAPEYFVEVTDGIEDIPLSPHFRLGQFLCKQEAGDGPAYLVVSEGLVLKLEGILQAANDRGWHADTFTVMSGYRTPAYNAGLGNGRNSRHIYGGAADIFIDTDRNGVMDDLNGDGQLDRLDAAVLYDLVESLSASGTDSWQAGGLGEYGPSSHHGGFVHVDERGYRARWGRG